MAARAPHYVRLDSDALATAVTAARRGGQAEIALEVAPGQILRSEAVWSERRGPDRMTWSGSVAGDPLGHVLLTVEGQAVVGRVVTGGRTYGIDYAGGGRQALYEVDIASLGPDCHVEEGEEYGAGPTPEPRRPGGGALEDGHPATVPIVVAYTSAVREAVGEEGVAALVQGAIDSANDVLVRTAVAGRLALAFAGEVPTADADLVPDTRAALRYLRESGDGVFDEVHLWRFEHGAALVSLLTELPGFCGAAFIPRELTPAHVLNSGFNVVQRDCAIANHSFVHEVGHNLGLLHDPYVNLNHGPFRFGHGYVSISDETDGQFRTVMAYASECADADVACPRVPYVSSASLTLAGYPLGEAEFSDVARALGLSMPFVSAVAGEGEAPDAPDFYLTTLEDESLTLIPNPDAIAVYVRSQPEHGEAEVHGDVTLFYRPDPDYFGEDAFTYLVVNDWGVPAVGTVYIEVEPVPDPPDPSTILAPANYSSVDLNRREGPLEVRWSEMSHPEFPEGGASLEATWHLSVSYYYESVFDFPVGDTTGLEVPIALLDEMMADARVPPGHGQQTHHWVVVSDGERSTRGPISVLHIRRLEESGDDEGDEEEDDEEATPPVVAALRAAYPNPARDAFTVEVAAPDEGQARIVLFDVVGRPARTYSLALDGGYNTLDLDLRGLQSGLYLYRIDVAEAVFRGRVVVL